jgi:hypothetical protein
MNGLTLHNRAVRATNVIPLEISPILAIIGYIILLSPTFINPERFSKDLIYWIITAIITMSVSWFTFFLFVVIGVAADFCAYTLITSIVITLIFYRVIIILKSGITISDINAEQASPLAMFTRPKKVTEEEISIAKEKQICLVCKNKLGGQIFLCSSCGAFYCIKCSDILSTLENACWVCDAPFDESKPVKLPEKDKDEVIVEEESIKNK